MGPLGHRLRGRACHSPPNHIHIVAAMTIIMIDPICKFGEVREKTHCSFEEGYVPL